MCGRDCSYGSCQCMGSASSNNLAVMMMEVFLDCRLEDIIHDCIAQNTSG